MEDKFIVNKTKITIIKKEINTFKLENDNIYGIVKRFREGKDDNYENSTLFYLVEKNDDHDVLYSVNLSKDDSDPDYIFRDVFLGCHIIDYTNSKNKIYEIEDSHIDQYDFSYDLLKALQHYPCASSQTLSKDYDMYNPARGTQFDAYIKNLQIPG